LGQSRDVEPTVEAGHHLAGVDVWQRIEAFAMEPFQ
jgi:hypothetical protein